MNKKKILIFAGFYIPSVKAGGPVQSIKNMVDHLHEDYDFYIVGFDRDLNDQRQFEAIETKKWLYKENSHLYYIKENELSIFKVYSIIKEISPNILYLNSFFSVRLSIFPLLLLRLNLIKVPKVILAPRGNFSSGALILKKQKKDLFISISNFFNLSKNIVFHATSKEEKVDILDVINHNPKIRIATNLTKSYEKVTLNKRIKEYNELKLIFLSRVHPKKNLKYLLLALGQIKEGRISLDIYGPIEDRVYWKDCLRLIDNLPNNIKVEYKGIVKNSEVLNKFKMYHSFVFPTLGENFGHVISEAFVGGCIVILSDQTPWRDLEKKNIGWDISLKNINVFIEKINLLLKMNQFDYDVYSKNAFEYGIKKSLDPENILSTKKIFDET